MVWSSVCAFRPPCLPGSLILQYSTGFDDRRGDCGLQRESMLFDVPLRVTADYGDWRFGPSGPRLYSDGVAARALPAGVAAVARL